MTERLRNETGSTDVREIDIGRKSDLPRITEKGERI
jgi:hypothetical protein